MAKYEKEFSRLIKCALEPILTKTFRCRQFEDGLKESITRYLTTVTSLHVVDFYQLVQAAMKIEKFEIMSQKRKSERKFSRGISSSGKRTRKSQVESVHSLATRSRRQGPTMTSGSGRGTSVRQEERLECSHYHKHHPSPCRWLTRGCFRCGNTDHLIVYCPQGSGSSRNPQESSRGGSNVPPSTHDRGRGRDSSGNNRRSIASETGNRPTITSLARAYAMRASEDQDAPRVIAGNFTLYDIEMHALVDPSSSHSYICIEQLSDKFSLVGPLSYDMHVTSPLGHSVRVN